MNAVIDRLMSQIPKDIFTDTTIKTLIPGSAYSRYGLVKRAIKNGDVIHLRRGLYAFSPKFRRHSLNLFEIAQKIYGPSYISFESALSYHHWIPEAVYTVTSASAKRSKEIKTPLGLFAYSRIPFQNFFAGVKREESPEGIFFIASPWRALADYVYTRKKDWMNCQPIIESLRVDYENLKNSDLNILKELSQSIENIRVRKFIKGILKELT